MGMLAVAQRSRLCSACALLVLQCYTSDQDPLTPEMLQQLLGPRHQSQLQRQRLRRLYRPRQSARDRARDRMQLQRRRTQRLLPRKRQPAVAAQQQPHIPSLLLQRFSVRRRFWMRLNRQLQQRSLPPWKRTKRRLPSPLTRSRTGASQGTLARRLPCVQLQWSAQQLRGWRAWMYTASSSSCWRWRGWCGRRTAPVATRAQVAVLGVLLAAQSLQLPLVDRHHRHLFSRLLQKAQLQPDLEAQVLPLRRRRFR